MTFVEYVARELMGEPEYRLGEGRWTCPHCDHNTWHVRPPKEGEKDRWSCWSCGAWGDAYDLVRFYNPRKTKRQLTEIWNTLREAWEQKHVRLSPGGRGPSILLALLKQGEIDHHDLLEVVAELKHRHHLDLERKRLGRRQKQEHRPEEN